MFGETTIFYVMIWNHPVETSIYKWLFGVPGETGQIHRLFGQRGSRGKTGDKPPKERGRENLSGWRMRFKTQSCWWSLKRSYVPQGFEQHILVFMVDSELLVDSWFQDIFSKKNYPGKIRGPRRSPAVVEEQICFVLATAGSTDHQRCRL